MTRMHFDKNDGQMLRENGRKALKRPNPVYLLGPVREAFTVETNEGELRGNVGDFVAHDPISGHVWPVSASYVTQHYDFIEDGS